MTPSQIFVSTRSRREYSRRRSSGPIVPVPFVLVVVLLLWALAAWLLLRGGL